MPKITYTHRAWLLFCPVYLGNVFNAQEFDDPLEVAPRYKWMDPLFSAALWVDQGVIAVKSFLGFAPTWDVWFSEEMLNDVVREYND